MNQLGSSNSNKQKKIQTIYLLILLLITTTTKSKISKHHYKNLYLSRDLKLQKNELKSEKIKTRNLSMEMMDVSPEKQKYPYKVTEDIHKGLEMVDPDLKTAVQQAEKSVEEDRDKKEIEGGSDDDGRVNDNEGYDEFGKKYPRDWSQPLKHEGNKCNLLLMKMFKLEGRLWSRKKDSLKICPGVAENCCTYMDELVILKLWDEYSKPHIVELSLIHI